VPNTVNLLLTNTTTGYHRDLQLLKEEIFPALASLKDCLAMTSFMLRSIQVKKEILQDPFFKHVFSVEVVNELVLKGVPFRNAYKQVGMDIESEAFSPDQTSLNHTHEGSIGNLQLAAIQEKMNHAVKAFNFDAIDAAFSSLLK
jgi:argininosuccinate lyase